MAESESSSTAPDTGPSVSGSGLHIDDVYLEGDTPDGTAVVGHLSVVVDAGGITVVGPGPDARRTVSWERMSSIELGPPATLPDGQSVSSLQFSLDGRPLRLLVPTGAAGVLGAVSSAIATPSAAPAAGGAVAVALRPDADTGAGDEGSVVSGAGIATVVAQVAPSPTADVAPPEVSTADATCGDLAPADVSPPDVTPADVAPADLTPADVPPADVTPADVAPADLTPADVPPADVAAGTEYADDAWEELPSSRWRSYPRITQAVKSPMGAAQRMRRLVLVTVLVVLVPVAIGVWSIRTAPPPAAPLTMSDHALAARVGIQPGELSGWQSERTLPANVFAAGANTGTIAASTARHASVVLARCLRVSQSALDDAFGIGPAAAQRSAEVGSRTYLDPAGNGGGVSSLVDVESTAATGRADAQVFADPSLFATCYQPFAQVMLPFADATGTTGGFTGATVEPTVVPVPAPGSNVVVAAFQIARIGTADGQSVTSVTTAVAVFGGRVQATVDMVSDFAFPLTAQDQLVRDIEARVIGTSLL